MQFDQNIAIFFISVVAGFLGSLLGLGGGIIVIPSLTLLFGIPIHEAIGASLISVIATSSGTAVAYVRDKIANIRIGMFLETATTLGAVTGAFIAGLISVKALYLTFSMLLFYSALAMIKKKATDTPPSAIPHSLAVKLKLNGEFYDKSQDRSITYQAASVYPAWTVMYGAGILSGLLGIGGGTFKVLAMDLYMRLPMKVSTATSNFMMGVTAAASAGVYFTRGDINPFVAGPVALGVLVGATSGTRVMARIKNRTVRLLFIPVLLYVAIEMFWKGLWM